MDRNKPLCITLNVNNSPVQMDLDTGSALFIMHRAGQRCFELLALIGSPQLSFSKVFPAEQTSWPNWQTLWACTEADA